LEHLLWVEPHLKVYISGAQPLHMTKGTDSLAELSDNDEVNSRGGVSMSVDTTEVVSNSPKDNSTKLSTIESSVTQESTEVESLIPANQSSSEKPVGGSVKNFLQSAKEKWNNVPQGWMQSRPGDN